MPATVVTTPHAGRDVVAVSGDLDLQTAPNLRQALVEALDRAAGNAGNPAAEHGYQVVVDLSDVGFLDSTGLAAFVAARAHAQQVGATLGLVCPDPDIRRVFAITALDTVFGIHDDLAAAGVATSSAGAPAARPGVAPAADDAVRAAVHLEARGEAPAQARRFVEEHLGAVPEDLRSDLTLLVSEVVTNAVRYGGDHLELRMSVAPREGAGDTVRIEVQDPGLGDLPEAPQAVAVTAGSGRGLMILDALASAWGVTPVDGAGKVVWFELAHTVG